jgi:hypothetical protein
VVGSDRYDAAVGRSPAGITFSEWALSNPSAWAYLAPIVIENDGWALFITTARGRNHAKSMLDMAQARDDWFSEVLPVNVTGAMSEEAVEQQRLEYTGIFGKEAAALHHIQKRLAFGADGAREQSLPTCSENPAVDRCPAAAGVDVKLPFAMTGLKSNRGKGSRWQRSSPTSLRLIAELRPPLVTSTA